MVDFGGAAKKERRVGKTMLAQADLVSAPIFVFSFANVTVCVAYPRYF